MNLRKSSYFKPLCLLVAALFTSQCVSIERKLISTEEKVIENRNQVYVYELEKIKTPSPQDPNAEYKIVKFPLNEVESINTYKLSKVNVNNSIFLGMVAGTCIGYSIGGNLTQYEHAKFGNAIIGLLLGGVLGSIVLGKITGVKSDLKKVIKVSTKSYLVKNPDSSPIPVQNFPLEFKWRIRGKINVYKTQTDEQGIARINLVDDLKMPKFPPDGHSTLYIHYRNPYSQLNGIFSKT
ncbi:MAG TPA: hypothetical protein VK186_22045, partial [Candidatus Deferrimicrobium sp.]|nr:hypothetical protein [Candidatus Deferrimicrobium sp.]